MLYIPEYVLINLLYIMKLYDVNFHLALIEQQEQKLACNHDANVSALRLCLLLAVQVVANFGGSSFTCDVSSLETDAQQCIQESVQQTQVSFPARVRPDFDPMPT